MRPALLLLAALSVVSCGATPEPLAISPDAKLAPPKTTVSPPPGPFNGTVQLTFSTDFPANVYVTTDGSDPSTSATRTTGPSPLKVTLTSTSTVKYFASLGGKDETTQEGVWVRAGGPVGTITGVLVVGPFATGTKVGITNNFVPTELGEPTAPAELAFSFSGLASGTYQLTGIMDRDHDGNLVPILDYQSAVTSITLDLNDPFKASAEGVRLYLGASATGLGTLTGTITLPNPPPLENLQISVLSPSQFTGGSGASVQTLLQLLQGGYRIFTSQTQTAYPYVVTDLQPGNYIPVPSLIGYGAGGVAVNLLANPLRTTTIVADHTTVQDFAFGPVTVTGQVTVAAASAPTGFGYGLIAARSYSFTEGLQAVLMPIILTTDATTHDAKSSYAGTAFRSNSTLSFRVFTNANGASPLTDALTWVVNPLAAQPAHATLTTTTQDATFDILVP